MAKSDDWYEISAENCSRWTIEIVSEVYPKKSEFLSAIKQYCMVVNLYHIFIDYDLVNLTKKERSFETEWFRLTALLFSDVNCVRYVCYTLQTLYITFLLSYLYRSFFQTWMILLALVKEYLPINIFENVFFTW